MSAADDALALLGDIPDVAGSAGGAIADLSALFARLASGVSAAGNALAKTSDAAKGATDATKATGEALKPLSAGADLSEKALSSLTGSAQKMLDGMAPASPALKAVTDSLKSMGPEGEAVAAVLQIVATAVTFAAVTLWDWVTAAIAAAQRRDALIATFNALGGAGAGEKMLAITASLAAGLPFVTAQVNAWAKAMAQVGKEGDGLKQSVSAIAASAAITQTAGDAAQSLIKRWALMAETGQKVKLDRRQLSALAESGADLGALAKILGTTKDKLGGMSLDAAKLGDAFEKALIAKGGPALENLGLTWDSIKAKFDEGFGAVFAGMSDMVRPLMVEIKGLFGEFNKGSPTIGLANGAMKSFLSGVFSLATQAVRGLHLMFLTIEVGALKAYVFLAPLIQIMRAIYSNAYVLKGLGAILLFLALPFIVVAAVVAALIVVIVALGAIVWVVISAVVGAFAWLVGGVVAAVQSVVASLQRFGPLALAAAGDFVSGLVAGISAGAGAVASAVSALATQAMDAFTGFFGIKSPSRKMLAHGKDNIAGALATGVDKGAPKVKASMSKMGDGPVGSGGGGGGSGKGSGGGNTFNFYGGDQAEHARWRAWVESYLEDQDNGGPEPAT